MERLAGAGEDAIQKLGGAAGADKIMGRLVTLKDRVDELQKSVRTIDRLERRLSAIERRLDKLEGKGLSSSRKTSGAGSKKKTSARKPSAGS